MLGHDLPFVDGPSITGQDHFLGFEKKEALVGYDVLTIGKLKHTLPPTYGEAGACHANAGLLPKLSDRSLFEALTLLDTAAWCGPVILSGQGTIVVNKPEKQNPSSIVQDQPPGRWSMAHRHSAPKRSNVMAEQCVSSAQSVEMRAYRSLHNLRCCG